MSDNSKIEWTEASWNPVTGCTKVSPGCDNCYAETFAERFRGVPGHHFEQGFDVTLRPERLDQPLRWKRPRRIFVNSMSDLFHDDIPDGYIAEVFAVMAATPRHTYQVLTKRHGRMRSLLRREEFRLQVAECAGPLPSRPMGFAWPLKNAWLGVSVEDQKTADLRIPALLETPAAVRWLSCEPLLGPIDLTGFLHWRPIGENFAMAPLPLSAAKACGLAALHWVVVGGESGRGARPMHPDWARGLRDQCTEVGVPYFFKQHGEWFPLGPLYDQDEEGDSEDARWDAVDVEVVDKKRVVELESTGHIADGYQPGDPRTWLMGRLGKKAAGRVLDGRTWNEYPIADIDARVAP